MFERLDRRYVESNLSTKNVEEFKDYLEIKPESEMTVAEARDFINSLFC